MLKPKIQISGVLSVILGAIVFGSLGISVRNSSDASELTQTFGRLFISFLAICLYVLVSKGVQRVKGIDVLKVSIAGFIGYSVMAGAFTLSILNTTISNTFFLLYTAPIFVAMLSPIYLKEKLDRKFIVALVFSIIGIGLMFNPADPLRNLTGNLFGLVTGISYAIYIVLVRDLSARYSAATITFGTTLTGVAGIFLAFAIFDSPIDEISNLSLETSFWIIFAGISIFLGYILLNTGLKKVPAAFASIFLLFEPLSSLVYGIIAFGEYPSLLALSGIFFIMASIVYLVLKVEQRG